MVAVRSSRLFSPRLWKTLASLCIVLLGALPGPRATAVGLVYVDADDGFSTAAPNLAPAAGGPLSNALDSQQTALDNKWGYRGLGVGATIFESGLNANPGDEDSPELVFNLDTADGLLANGSYDIYVAYWSANGQNWSIRAGMSSGNHTLFNRPGPLPFLPNAVAGIPANTALWTTAPAITTEADRTMYLGKVGTATALGGQINLYIDDLPTSGFPESSGGNSFNYRSWLDGAAFIEAGTPITVTATINRNSGQITLSNSTGHSLDIVSYSISSAAGSLNPGTWLSISDNYDGDDGAEFDASLWNITAPTMPFPAAATALSEAEDASGGGGGAALTPTVLNLGNAWIRSPIQDVQISLTISNASVLNVVPQYTGNAIAAGDFDADGDVDPTDISIFKANLHTNVSTLTRAQTIQKGDLTGDLAVNYSDYVAFRDAYDTFNGVAGAFELAYAVPEPASLLLLALPFGLIAFVAHRRKLARRLSYCCLPIRESIDMQQVHFVEDIQVNQHSFRSSHSRAAAGPRIVRHSVATPLTLVILVVTGAATQAQLVYVDADRNTNTGPAAAIKAGVNGQADDNLWSERTGFSSGGNFFQSGDGDGEDSPQLTTTLTGLTPYTLYSVNAHFWDAGPAWTIRAGYTSGNLPHYANPGEAAANGAQPAVLASTLTYATAPTVFVEADRTMYAAVLGPTKSDANGNLNVYIDDRPSTIGVNNRTWYDGLSYQLASVLTLRVNTTSGAVSIHNDTGNSFNMNYYEIRSATGALNFGGWNSLDDQDATSIATSWNEAAGSSANLLSEFNVLGTKAFAAASGQSLGSAFMPGGAQNLAFFYGLAGGSTLQPGYVEYVTGGLGADFDGDQDVDGNDLLRWQRGESPSPLSATDLSNWKGSFGSQQTAVAAAIPEPAGIILGLFGVAALSVRSTWTRRFDRR
jgi:hypothetical protein